MHVVLGRLALGQRSQPRVRYHGPAVVEVPVRYEHVLDVDDLPSPVVYFSSFCAERQRSPCYDHDVDDGTIMEVV